MNKPLGKDGFAEESGNTMIERTEYYRIGRTILFVLDTNSYLRNNRCFFQHLARSTSKNTKLS
jgi:type I restriction-modification system DNA methylase subunit